MLTRRCTERMFLLGASKESSECFAYCLAEAAQRFGVIVHAAVVMSNHLHIVITDTRAELPRFAHLFFTQLAKATNARTGHTESVFARTGRYHCLELLTEEAIAHEIAYLLANPAKAGLVERASDWPGFITAAEDMFARRVYTASVGLNPYLACRKAKTLDLQVEAPPSVENVEGWVRLVAAEQEQLERQAREVRRAAGVGTKGAAAVRSERWFRKPNTHAKLFQLTPTLAERRRSIRIEGIEVLKNFRSEYRIARDAFCAGRRRVVFPAGTWALRVVYRVSTAVALPAAAVA